MRRITTLLSLAFVLSLAPQGSAWAQSTLDDDAPAAPEVKEPKITDEPQAEYGIGLRGFMMITPQFLLEAFFEEVPSGGVNPGFALEFIRRKGDFELAIGLGYNPLSTDDGNYLEKGDDNRKLCSLYLSLMQRLGLPADRFGDADAPPSHLSEPPGGHGQESDDDIPF